MYRGVGAAEGIVDDVPCAPPVGEKDRFGNVVPVFSSVAPRSSSYGWRAGGPEHSYSIGSKGGRYFKQCCPINSWSNATYLAVAGPSGLQSINENRIRSLASQFDTLLAQEPSIAGGLGITESLKNRLKDAFQSFNSKLPASRWAAAPGSFRNVHCTGDGTYPTFVDTQNVALTDAQRSVIMSVPTSEPSLYLFLKPRFQDLFDGSQMGPWLKSFVDAFAPTLGQRIASSSRGVKTRIPIRTLTRRAIGPSRAPAPPSAPAPAPAPAPSPAPSPMPSTGPSLPAPPPQPDGMSTGAKVALGVGALAAIGGIAYFATRK